MIDTLNIESLIKQQVKETVASDVLTLLEDPQWLSDIEQTIIQYAQGRIIAKFDNSESMPLLINTVKQSVHDLFANSELHKLMSLVDTDIIVKVVNEQLMNKVAEYTKELFNDEEWTERIRGQVVSIFVSRLTQQLNNIDINVYTNNRIDELFAEYVKTIQYTGLVDKGNKTELTILDKAVIVENELFATNITTVEKFKTKDLIVTGDINIDGSCWKQLSANIQQDTYNQFVNDAEESLVDRVLSKAKNNTIDFSNITINGKALVTNNILSDTITESSLSTVGELESLIVAGSAEINKCLHVNNNRVGINTDMPNMALSIWDEEVEISFGKLKQKVAYIGSSRIQELHIGINRVGSLIIESDGLVTINQLRVGKNRISHSADLPGYKGSKGDIVFNTDVSKDNPIFAWICIGSFNWKVLKTS